MRFALKYTLVLQVITLLTFVDRIHAVICTKNPNLDAYICNYCTIDANGNEYCSGCNSGLFAFRGTCIACPQLCSACNIDFASNSTIWTTVSTFWDQKFQDALTTETGPSPVPSFLNNYQFSTMTAAQKQRWIEAYYFYKSFESEINKVFTSAQFRPILFSAVNLIQSTLTANYTNQWSQIASFVNLKLNLSLSLTNFSSKVDSYVGSMAKCVSCLPRFYYDSTSFSCKPCDKSCYACSNASSCSACQANQFPVTWYNSSQFCVICTVTGCNQCIVKDPTKCMQCNAGYYLSASKCLSCLPQCTQCSNSTYCTNCQQGFTNTSQGQCIKCASPNCASCDSTNTSFCYYCLKPNETTINGLCGSCGQGCLWCQSALACMTCFQGYKLVNGSCIAETGICKQYDPNNAGKCISCYATFYLDDSTGLCQLCQQNVLDCKGLKKDLEDKLVNYNYVRFGYNFARCRPGCQTCSNTDPQKCIRCKYFYYLNTATQTCEKCKSGCKICRDGSSCILCAQNYYYKNGQCLLCGERCSQCYLNIPTNGPVCTSFISRYYGVNAYNTCPQGCLLCKSNNGVAFCQYCKIGYTLDQNYNCLKCASSCRSCNYKNITECQKVFTDFPFDLVTGQQQTKAMIVRPIGCNINVNGNCVNAALGYQLVKINGSFVAQWKCLHPCNVCNGTQCTVCKAGYNLSSGVCVPDLSCNPNCKYCVVGSYKDSATSTCKACSLANCGSCPNNVCKQCNQGYYLDLTSSTCVVCPAKCKTCNDQKTCQVCAKGYVSQIIQTFSYGYMKYECFPCADNCATCYALRDICTSCKDGYILNGTDCVGYYAVQFSIELDTVYSTFVTSGSAQQFATDIATIANVSVSDITITKISQGSAIVAGAIFSTSQTSANGIQTSLQSNTATIAGSTVLTSSSSVVVNTPPTPSPTPGPSPNDPSTNTEVNDTPAGSKNKVAIIVGSVVGGAALITILGIGIYLYKKHKSQSIPTSQLQVSKNNLEDKVSSQPIQLN